MRAIPFFLIMAILVGGVFVAFQTFNGDTGKTEALAARPTVTPRAWPTSPPRPLSPTFAADPFQSQDSNQASAAPGLQPADQPMPIQPGGLGSNPVPSPGVPAPTPTRSELSQATPTPPQNTPTTSPSGQAAFMVGNTGGEGVYLRGTPKMDDKLRPWDENTPMVVIGPRVEGDGHMWEHVRAPDGSEGYIPAEYLVGQP